MEQVLFPIELTALTLGAGVMLVLLLSHQRSGRTILLDLSLTQAGATLLLIHQVMESYEQLTRAAHSTAATPVAAVFTALGCGLFGYAIPAFARHVVTAPETGRDSTTTPTPWVTAARLAAPLACAIVGALSALVFFDPGPVILLGLVQLYATIFIAIHRRQIRSQDRQALVLPLLYLVAAVLVLQVVFSVLMIRGSLPSFLADPDLAPLVSYVAISAILIRYAVKVLFMPATAVALTVSDAFMARYGISPREGEIIRMILQGHSNRVIGVRLFISDRTVKNHVYSIYRKTGASNKIQLLNLVGSIPERE